jgi:glutathione S-transferase
MTRTVLGRITSINVRKVLWACDELGLSYLREDADVRAPAFLARNPNAQIPVIIDEDVVLWESHTIMRYLANRHGGEALYPHDAVARARVDQWLDWQASDLNPAWSYAFHARVRKTPGYDIPAMIAGSITRWTQLMQVLDGHLHTRAFVAGDAFSLADITIGLSVTRWLATPFEKPDLPGVTAYYARLSLRPAFVAYGLSGMP